MMNKQFARLPSTAPLDLVQFFLFFFDSCSPANCLSGTADQDGRPVLPIASNNERVGKKTSKERKKENSSPMPLPEKSKFFISLFSLGFFCLRRP